MIGVSRRAIVARLRRHAPSILLGVGALGLGAGGAMGVRFVEQAIAAPHEVREAAVRAGLRLRLPKTKLGAIDCRRIPGVCEIVAGSALFYVDPAARYLFIGHAYDMETRSDLTAARLLALDPGALVRPAGASTEAQGRDPDVEPAAAPKRVDPAKFPRGGAITWGAAAGPRLIVLSDFACGYCRKLVGELARLKVRVEEHPISIFGPASRRLAEQVLCAKGPVKALHAAYRGAPVAAEKRCDVSGLDRNEAFARDHGFGGTPVMIRSDGAVLEGYRPAVVIRAFLEGKQA